MRPKETLAGWTCFGYPRAKEKWQAMFIRSYLPIEDIITYLSATHDGRKYKLSPWWSMGLRSVAFLFTTSESKFDRVVKVIKPWASDISPDNEDVGAWQNVTTSSATTGELAKRLFEEYRDAKWRRRHQVLIDRDPYEFLCQMANSAAGVPTTRSFQDSHNHVFQHQEIRRGILTAFTEPEAIQIQTPPIRCDGDGECGMLTRHSSVCIARHQLFKQCWSEFLNAKFLELESIPLVPIQVCGFIHCGLNTPWLPYTIMPLAEGTAVDLVFKPFAFDKIKPMTHDQIQRAKKPSWICLATTQLKLSRHTGSLFGRFHPRFSTQNRSIAPEEMVAGASNDMSNDKFPVGSPYRWSDPCKRLRHLAAKKLSQMPPDCTAQQQRIASQVVGLFLCVLDEPDQEIEFLLHTSDMGGSNVVYNEEQGQCRSFDHEQLWLNPTPIALCPPFDYGLALGDFLESANVGEALERMWCNRKFYADIMRSVGTDLGLGETAEKLARAVNSDLTLLFEALELVHDEKWDGIEHLFETERGKGFLDKYSELIRKKKTEDAVKEYFAWTKRCETWNGER